MLRPTPPSTRRKASRICRACSTRPVRGGDAKEAEALGAWLVHYSTDYVFDGGGERPGWKPMRQHRSTSTVKPKLAGEHLCARHLIFPHQLGLRRPWRQSLPRPMLRFGKERSEMSVINDQFGAPTGAELLAGLHRPCDPRGAEQTEVAGSLSSDCLRHHDLV